MTLYQFKNLNKGRKLEVVCQNGVRLLEREEGDFMITLYQIGYFYVEVFFHQNKMHITQLRSHNSTVLLEPYLEQMNINFLFQDWK